MTARMTDRVILEFTGTLTPASMDAFRASSGAATDA